MHHATRRPEAATTLCSSGNLSPHVRKSQTRHQIYLPLCLPPTLHFAPPNLCCLPVISLSHNAHPPRAEHELSAAPLSSPMSAGQARSPERALMGGTCRVPNASKRQGGAYVCPGLARRCICMHDESKTGSAQEQVTRQVRRRWHVQETSLLVRSSKCGARPASRFPSVRFRDAWHMWRSTMAPSWLLCRYVPSVRQRARGCPLPAARHACMQCMLGQCRERVVCCLSVVTRSCMHGWSASRPVPCPSIH